MTTKEQDMLAEILTKITRLEQMLSGESGEKAITFAELLLDVRHRGPQAIRDRNKQLRRERGKK